MSVLDDTERLREVVARSTTYSQVLREFGLRTVGANPHRLRVKMHEHGISWDHFNRSSTVVKSNRRWTDEEIFTYPSPYQGRTTMKKRLVQNLGMEYKCALCGIKDWLEQPLSLHLDHIDGDQTNNRVENLRFLCPNCHSQTDTYCGKNQSGDRHWTYKPRFISL